MLHLPTKGLPNMNSNFGTHLLSHSTEIEAIQWLKTNEAWRYYATIVITVLKQILNSFCEALLVTPTVFFWVYVMEPNHALINDDPYFAASPQWHSLAF